jgi:hypothetical protein
MFIHPTTALELAAQRRLDEERRARVRARPTAEARTIRPAPRRYVAEAVAAAGTAGARSGT